MLLYTELSLIRLGPDGPIHLLPQGEKGAPTVGA